MLLNGDRVVHAKWTYERRGMFVGYNPDGTCVVVWDDDEGRIDLNVDPDDIKKDSLFEGRRMIRVHLGLLRTYLRESVSMTGTSSRSAPTDPDAQVPGHLPNELPKSASLDDDPLDETDARMVGDDMMDGDPSVDDTHDGMKVASHLRSPEEQLTLGDPPDRQGEALIRDAEELAEEVHRFFRGLRVGRRSGTLAEEPAAGSLSNPVGAKGLYSDFDMAKDHGDVARMQGTWYRSPGRTAGGDGDPFRGPDPYSQLGFHPPAGEHTPDNAPPGSMGQVGVQARETPPIWQLSAGGDTSKVLGANAHADSVGSGDEQEAGEEAGEEGAGEAQPGQPAGPAGTGEGHQEE